MKKIELDGKSYPFEINNNVYEAIVDECNINPFSGDIGTSNPKVISVIAYTAIREGMIINGQDVKDITREFIGRITKTSDMLIIANLFMDDLVKSMDYAKAKLSNDKEEGKD